MLKKPHIVIIITFIALIAFLFSPVKIPYTIHTQGLILASKEWTLSRTLNGYLVSSETDNKRGYVSSYKVTEFKRGDVAEFLLNPKLYSQNYILKGDTLGVLNSNEEQRHLLELLGDYEILHAELLYYSTGQKPEDVMEAKNRLELVKQKLETQKKLIERTEALYRDSLISPQEYEIKYNEYRIQELNKEVAEAHYFSVTTGDKPEKRLLIMAKIKALESQIDQIRKRLENFTLVSPLTGMLVKDISTLSPETLVKVADTTSYTMLLPVELYEKQFINKNSRVELKIKGSLRKPQGKIIRIDNSAQILNGKQAIFTGALFENLEIGLTPGAYTEAVIHCPPVTPLEYLGRIAGFIISK
jgi:hypothetical protein